MKRKNYLKKILTTYTLLAIAHTKPTEKLKRIKTILAIDFKLIRQECDNSGMIILTDVQVTLFVTKRYVFTPLQ